MSKNGLTCRGAATIWIDRSSILVDSLFFLSHERGVSRVSPECKRS